MLCTLVAARLCNVVSFESSLRHPIIQWKKNLQMWRQIKIRYFEFRGRCETHVSERSLGRVKADADMTTFTQIRLDALCSLPFHEGK
jgi:hypothetical protein